MTSIIAKDPEVREMPVMIYATDIQMIEGRLIFFLGLKIINMKSSVTYCSHAVDFDEKDSLNDATSVIKQFLAHFEVDSIHKLVGREVPCVVTHDLITNTTDITINI